jgi:hypothetical protein
MTTTEISNSSFTPEQLEEFTRSMSPRRFKRRKEPNRRVNVTPCDKKKVTRIADRNKIPTDPTPEGWTLKKALLSVVCLPLIVLVGALWLVVMAVLIVLGLPMLLWHIASGTR